MNLEGSVKHILAADQAGGPNTGVGMLGIEVECALCRHPSDPTASANRKPVRDRVFRTSHLVDSVATPTDIAPRIARSFESCACL